MTLTRAILLCALYLAATFALVGLCGVPGLLTWIACMCLGMAAPDRVVDAVYCVASVRWRHITAAWAWLDRR